MGKDQQWEVVVGGHSGSLNEFSVWPVGAGGDGDKRVACWIRTPEIASLVSAAPDLLAACQSLLERVIPKTKHWEIDQDIVKARAAIAKALGHVDTI